MKLFAIGYGGPLATQEFTECLIKAGVQMVVERPAQT